MKNKKSHCAHKNLKHLFVISLILFVCGCATIPSPPVPRHPDGYVLHDLCVRYRIACSLEETSQVVTLQKDHISARAIVGSNIAIVDNKKINLSRSVWIARGVVFVPWDFKEKVMQLMLVKTSPFAQRFRKIMIDAGHGGKDPGGIGVTGIQEKDVVLDIALRLEKALRQQGVETVLTRKTDVFLDLSERTRLAQQQGADLFVSVHANIAKSRAVQGVEVFYLHPLDERTKTDIYDPVNYRSFFRNFSMKQNDEQLKTILADMLYINKQHESYRISQYISDRLSKDLNTPNRGHKEAGFYVLKHILVPSVLVEVGFLSNPQEEQNLGCSHYRQRIADSLVDAMMDYVRYH